MTESMPTVLVGIVTRNRSGILPKAITSALKQKGCQVRVSVIDDCSTDSTAQVALQFPNVDWIQWSESRGYMEARNLWMRSAIEDYFVSLDDDAWFLKGDEIALAIDYMKSHSNVAAMGFDILSPDHPDCVSRTAPRPASVFIGCGHILRLTAIKATGYYESSPGSYGGEEKDLCLRLMDQGYEIMFMPGVHVWHDKTMQARDEWAQHRSGVCNDLVMTFRRTPISLLPFAFVTKMWRHLKHSKKHGITKPCLEGFQLFVRSFPAICRSRNPVRIETLRTFLKLAKPGDTPVDAGKKFPTPIKGHES